jgi:DNA invertase Pin-like site-specific DNA recombinase
MKRRRDLGQPGKPRGTARQLPEHEVDELVTAYEAGATVYELARRFKIHRTTASLHLQRQGVPMRRQGLDEEQVELAAQLYRLGWSVAKIGERFGVDQTTVWRVLRERGVPMRRPWERPLSD